MLRPLFESFNESTATKTLQEFIHSVLKWFEDNCSLTVLRPGISILCCNSRRSGVIQTVRTGGVEGGGVHQNTYVSKLRKRRF